MAVNTFIIGAFFACLIVGVAVLIFYVIVGVDDALTRAADKVDKGINQLIESPPDLIDYGARKTGRLVSKIQRAYQEGREEK